jgi:hypothetical protein
MDDHCGLLGCTQCYACAKLAEKVRQREAAQLAAVILSLCIVLAIVAWTGSAVSGQWDTDSATTTWFKSLHNDRGQPCCDHVDGVRIEDPDWRELDRGRFEVFARGEWQTIDPDRVIKGTNRVGYAILWWPEGFYAPTCFLPGSQQ